jgi:YD repeat-containing protein
VNFVRRLSTASALLFAVTLALASTAEPARAETVQYTYDALGRIVTVTYGSGAVITYAYDNAGNRTQVVQTPPPPPPPSPPPPPPP